MLDPEANHKTCRDVTMWCRKSYIYYNNRIFYSQKRFWI